jgi:hypothetical protein
VSDAKEFWAAAAPSISAANNVLRCRADAPTPMFFRRVGRSPQHAQHPAQRLEGLQ